MARYVHETLVGYDLDIAIGDPDAPDDGTRDVTLLFASPERDEQGRALHTIAYPLTGRGRQALTAALAGGMSEAAPHAKAIAEVDPIPKESRPDAAGHCPGCRWALDSPDPQCSFPALDATSSDDFLNLAIAQGCRVAATIHDVKGRRDDS